MVSAPVEAPERPRLWNRRGLAPRAAVYVGRPTRWGNPFARCRDDGSAATLAEFARYATERQRHEPIWLLPLRGRDLVCWCGPGPCHGQILLQLANASPDGAGDAAPTLEGQLTIGEVAQVLGCYRSTVNRLIARGVLRAERLGAARFCDAAEVTAFATQGSRRRGRPRGRAVAEAEPGAAGERETSERRGTYATPSGARPPEGG